MGRTYVSRGPWVPWVGGPLYSGGWPLSAVLLSVAMRRYNDDGLVNLSESNESMSLSPEEAQLEGAAV